VTPDQSYLAGSVLGLLIRELQTSAEMRNLRVEATYDKHGDYAPVILLRDNQTQRVRLAIEVRDVDE
jgi:hypothetical protein